MANRWKYWPDWCAYKPDPHNTGEICKIQADFNKIQAEFTKILAGGNVQPIGCVGGSGCKIGFMIQISELRSESISLRSEFQIYDPNRSKYDPN